jgi:heme-degrading monooxygenase HmoA
LESPILIDVWTVEPEEQEALVAALSANLRRVVLGRPGFVSAEIYQSANRDLVVLNLRMQSARDRQALTDSQEVEEIYRELRAIATSHRHIYRLVESFHPPPPGPGE